MRTCQYVLATVFLAVAAAADTKYASFSQFTKAGCGAADSDGYKTILAMDVCSQMSKLSTGPTGNITITSYTDNKCSGTGTVVFNLPLQTCGTYNGKFTMFTATSQEFPQACSGLRPPYVATYMDGNCTGDIVSARAQSTSCLAQTATTSTNAQCIYDNYTVTAVTCSYIDDDKCTGECLPQASPKANVCQDAGGTYMKYNCPDELIPPFCPSMATTKKDDKMDAGEIGGIVAAVILIPLVIIAVAVVVYVFLRKGGKESSADDSGLMDGSQTTYGSA